MDFLRLLSVFNEYCHRHLVGLVHPHIQKNELILVNIPAEAVLVIVRGGTCQLPMIVRAEALLMNFRGNDHFDGGYT